MAKSFDVQAAKKAGATQAQIDAFMRQNNLQPLKTMGSFLGNVGSSTGRLIGDTAGAVANVFNPDMEKNTVANLARLGSGIIQLAIPGEQGNEKLAREVGKFYADRYGSIDKAFNTLYNDPAGMVADFAGLAGGAGLVARGVGTAGKATNLAKAGTRATQFANKIDPLVMAGKGASKVAKKGIRGLDDWSRGYATAGIGNPAQIKEADRILKGTTTRRIDPVTGKAVKSTMTSADLIAEGNLYGRSTDDVTRFSKQLMKKFDSIADNPNLKVKIEDITKPLDKLIESTQQALLDFPGEQSFITQLDELTRQRQNLVSKAVNGVIPGDEALRMRRSLDAVTSDAASRGVQLRPGEMQAKQSMVSGLRSGLREADPRLTAIGRKTQAIGFDQPGKQGPLMKAVGGYESRAQVRNPITLTGAVTSGAGFGAGSMLGGPIGAFAGSIAAPLVKQALTSPTGIKAVSKGGQSSLSPFFFIFLIPSLSARVVYPGVRQARMVNRGSQESQQQSPQQFQPTNQVKDQSYGDSIPQQQNVFNNKAGFGRTFRLKAGSFN
jgi:uncharacterized protein (DUF1810 family)